MTAHEDSRLVSNTEEWTSYRRLVTALHHREPDRVPFDLGGSMVTGINVRALTALRQVLGLPGEARVLDRVTQMAETGDDVRDLLRVDVRSVRPNAPGRAGLARDLGWVGDHDRLIDEFGIGWQMPRHGGHYYDLCFSPLAECRTVADIERYPWPDALDPARFEGLKPRVDQVVEQERRGVVVERMHAGMWEHAMWMRGYEQFFMEMVTEPALVHAIMSKELEVKTAYWGRALDLLDRHTLVLSTADDLGTQSGPLVSVGMYRDLIWPYHRQLFQFLKSRARTEIFIFFHCDGAIWDFVPLLIEAGVDILNPWQVNCKGMDDTRRFKREFGRDLTIWGGSCDTQAVLPFGTPRQVRDETRRRIEDLAPGGGFVFAPIHVIQAGVPPENIIAWWETLMQYGRYHGT
ncbi:MAG: uroporphyrinogen decarboxylase family protein [Acidobacteriota bacterium]